MWTPLWSNMARWTDIVRITVNIMEPPPTLILDVGTGKLVWIASPLALSRFRPVFCPSQDSEMTVYWQTSLSQLPNLTA